MTSYEFADWRRLPGARVEVRRHGELVRIGTAEAATEDSSILWLARDGVEERVMIEKSSDYQIWIEPNQLRNPLRNSPAQPETATARRP